MNRIYESRFFKKDDPKIHQILFELPSAWWSRFHEYSWALEFVSREDVVLDAACGVSHPFKFFITEKCKEVHACDMDGRIENMQEIIKDVKKDFGEEAVNILSKRELGNLNLKKCYLTCLPYEEDSFNKIFCISVLEHLPKVDLYATLEEFKRTLCKDGEIILTFDYPTVDLLAFKEVIDQVGLVFAGDYSFIKPSDALTSNLWGELYCFRAVLKKKI